LIIIRKAPNQHIITIYEGSCDTEDCEIDAIQLYHHMNELHFKGVMNWLFNFFYIVI